MNKLVAFIVLFNSTVSLLAHQNAPHLNPSNAEFIVDYKNFASQEDRLGNLQRYAKLFALASKDLIAKKEFQQKYNGRINATRSILHDFSKINQETGGGEGQIYQLVKLHPDLESYKDLMLEINYAHLPDSKAQSILNNELVKYKKTYITNAATDTVNTWKNRYPEAFKNTKVIHPPIDKKALKMPNPYFYNLLKQEIYGKEVVPQLSETEHAQIPQEKIAASKQQIWIADQKKIDGAIKAGLPIAASYAYNKSAFVLMPTSLRLYLLKRSLRNQGVEL